MNISMLMSPLPYAINKHDLKKTTQNKQDVYRWTCDIEQEYGFSTATKCIFLCQRYVFILYIYNVQSKTNSTEFVEMLFKTN